MIVTYRFKNQRAGLRRGRGKRQAHFRDGAKPIDPRLNKKTAYANFTDLDELKTVFAKHPTAIYVSVHTHFPLDTPLRNAIGSGFTQTFYRIYMDTQIFHIIPCVTSLDAIDNLASFVARTEKSINRRSASLSRRWKKKRPDRTIRIQKD